MLRRRRSQRSRARSTRRHLRWPRRLPNPCQADHQSKLLLEDYAARLLPFCEEVCSMSDTRTLYSCSSNIFTICCLSMAIFYVGLRCRRSHHSFCFKWPQILSCRNRIFHQVGRSHHSSHSRRPTRGLFHSQEHPLPFRHPT